MEVGLRNGQQSPLKSPLYFLHIYIPLSQLSEKPNFCNFALQRLFRTQALGFKNSSQGICRNVKI